MKRHLIPSYTSSVKPTDERPARIEPAAIPSPERIANDARDYLRDYVTTNYGGYLADTRN